MARAIDLSYLSLDELYVLAGRVQSRIATLTTSTATIRQTSAREHTDPWASSGNASPDPSPSGNASPDPSRPGLVPGNRSETQATLSERVQDLVNTNDPWEGSGVGPTRWSLPFYGGHVIRTHESAACLHHVQHGPATLPVFGGPPCSDISGQAPTTSLTREQPAVAPAQFSPTITCMQLCAICYSPCCLGGTTHGLHACERHRRR